MKPVIHETAFVADNATVRGNVTIGEGAGIYFGAVLRAETDPITIGPGTNIQDNCVLHADPGFPTSVGRDCVIAAGALATQGAVIPDGSMVMGAPGKVRRPLTPEEIASNAAAAADYRRESQLYKAGEL